MDLGLVINKITPVTLSVALSVVAILFTTAAFHFGIPFIILSLACVVGLPIALCVIIYPKFGIITLLTSSYLVMFITRFGVNFPLGTLMDTLQLLLIFGFFISQKLYPNWKDFKNSSTAVILIWIVYNLLQFFNMDAVSQLAWVYSIRAVALVVLLYFVFMTHVKSLNFIRLILKLWIALAFFAALYAFKQEHFGFFQFEIDWLMSDQNYTTLYYIAGRWRKFSIFSDPVAFSYNMVTCAILCLVLIFNNMKIYKKVILGFLVAFFLVNMVYSGTRAAYVLFPAAMVLLVVLKLNLKVFIFSFFGFLFLVGLIFAPIYTPNIMRFQSAFRPSDDPSFNLRTMNQKKIQPFIQKHPFGGGLGSVGTWGARFTPNTYLASFQPDSGYVRVAVESGWVGLFLICSLFFAILQKGIRNYYLIRDPELKTYCLAMVLIIFALSIGNYPQEAIVQFPTSVYFYLFIAMIHITKKLDDQKTNNGKK